jgi:hypothetical protein
MTYKARKRLALLILIVGLPVYMVIAVSVMGIAPRFPKVLELMTYVTLGIGWIFPLKWVFLGIAQADPDAGE